LFPTLKKFLGGRHFKSDEEMEEAVDEWLNGLAAEVYEEGIQKLVTGCDKCLHVGDSVPTADCVDKYLGVSNSYTLHLCCFFGYFFIAKRSLLSGSPSYLRYSP
jgi:hypothetical protein